MDKPRARHEQKRSSNAKRQTSDTQTAYSCGVRACRCFATICFYSPPGNVSSAPPFLSALALQGQPTNVRTSL